MVLDVLRSPIAAAAVFGVFLAAGLFFLPTLLSHLRLKRSFPSARSAPLQRRPDNGFTRPPSQQLSSPLFSRLPHELRLAIYARAIGRAVVHLDHDTSTGGVKRYSCYYAEGDRAWHHPCWKPEENATIIKAHARASGVFGGNGDGKRNSIVDVDGGRCLGLLQSCQRLCDEVTPLLYQTQTFHVPSASLLTAFLARTPTSSTQHIRSLKIFLTASDLPPPLYAAAWASVASLPALRELRVLLSVPLITRDVWKQYEAEWLEPIRAFGAARGVRMAVWEVYVTVFPDWIGDEWDWRMCGIHQIKDMKQLSGSVAPPRPASQRNA